MGPSFKFVSAIEDVFSNKKIGVIFPPEKCQTGRDMREVWPKTRLFRFFKKHFLIDFLYLPLQSFEPIWTCFFRPLRASLQFFTLPTFCVRVRHLGRKLFEKDGTAWILDLLNISDHFAFWTRPLSSPKYAHNGHMGICNEKKLGYLFLD